ncbi:hypothetical protein N7519_004227 [Penicillium mononematosum]|uniref:uncharacterized protein n=1 Tax=Penicillium mononematosum TaxID=268346 RepID=UPI00254923ED|nr:uncharacterized protein N7519_004227 [Penicillium mononematosum]KAJ6189319.1 hypothetical protein N7519_004227 [Penicillium mononematosum]
MQVPGSWSVGVGGDPARENPRSISVGGDPTREYVRQLTCGSWVIRHDGKFCLFDQELEAQGDQGDEKERTENLNCCAWERGLKENDSDESKMKNSKETSFKIRHDG